MGEGLLRRPWLPLLVGVLAGLFQAVRKWLDHKPEWAHYRLIAAEPLALSPGPVELLFGHLPGLKALLLPFASAGAAGFASLMVVNVVCLFGLYLLLGKIVRRLRDAWVVENGTRLWISCCLAGPAFLALQNHQVVPIATFLLMLALYRSNSGRLRSVVTYLAIATLFKSFVLLVLPILALHRLWRAALLALVLALGLSVLLAGMTDGIASSLYHHWIWPSLMLAENPWHLLLGSAPSSMSSNQSSMVYLTRLADWLGAPWLVVFHLALCLAGLLALAAVALTNHREDLWYLLVLVWVSLLLVLLPFTRYYDVLFIAPLWAALGAVRWQTSVLWMRTRWILPVTPFFMLGHNPVFAIVAVVTLGLGLVAISSRVKLPKREDVIEFLAGILSARAISPCGIALLAIIALGMGVHRSMPSSAASLDAIVAAADLTLPDAKGHLLVMASPATIHASANYAEIFSFDPQRVDALIESLSDPGDNDAVVVSYRHLRRLAALETDGRLHRVAANEHFVLLREHSDRSATDEPRR